MRELTILTGMLEALFLCGLVYNMSTLKLIFVGEGVFSDVCDNLHVAKRDTRNQTSQPFQSCQAQEDKFSEISNQTIFAFSLVVFFLGPMLDKQGMFQVRILGSLAFLLCFVLLYFIPTFPFLLKVAWFALACGTIIPLITLLPMAKLLPKYSPILITLINGIYDASMAMVTVPVKLYESGFSYMSVISIYFGSAVFFLLRSIFLLPMKNLPVDVENYSLQKNTPASKMCFSKSEDLEEKFGLEDKEDVTKFSLKKAVKYLIQPIFLIYTLWYVILDMRIIGTSVTMNIFALEFFKGDGNLTEEVQNRANEGIKQFSSSNLISLFMAPVGGVFVSALEHTWSVRRNRSIAILIAACSVCFATFSFLELQKGNELAFTIMCILFPIGRTLFYGTASMYLLEIFPVDMYGSLFGTSNLVAAFGIFFNNKFLIRTKQFEISSKFYFVAALATGLLLTILTFIKTKDELNSRKNESASTSLTTITNENEPKRVESKKLMA